MERWPIPKVWDVAATRRVSGGGGMVGCGAADGEEGEGMCVGCVGGGKEG